MLIHLRPGEMSKVARGGIQQPSTRTQTRHVLSAGAQRQLWSGLKESSLWWYQS